MSDVAGIVLHSILKNPESVLEIWPKLKIQFFSSEYSQIFVAISKYYNKYNEIPSFESLKITTRDQSLVNNLQALEFLPISEDIDVDIAVDALKDQFTQEETLDQLSNFVDKLVTYDSSETKLKLAEVLQHLEEQTDTAEEVCLMNDLFLFDEEELLSRIALGLNNTFDSSTGGMGLTELIMIGGHRGSGKTVAGCNIAANQYNNDGSCLFFSIEMRKREIFNRFVSILSGVPNENIKLNRCSPEEQQIVARTRADMFVDSEEVYQDFLKHKDYKQFEVDLIRSKQLTPNQIITIDNQGLTLADIDLNIQKFKSLHGDRLKTVVVDYVNQIQIPDIYNWQSQIMLSKKLKDLAVKHNVLMITPYQTDTSGEARFSKGLLDAADVAVVLTNDKDNQCINFSSTKVRGYKDFEFNAPCEWNSLRILPNDAIIHSDDDIDEKPKTKQQPKEEVEDIPWK